MKITHPRLDMGWNSSPVATTTPAHLFVLGDSLSFHGPDQTHPPDHPGLYPQVCAAALSSPTQRVEVDLLARQGWTARDAWWGLTKDPMAFGTYVHRADFLVIGVGGMDHLPAAVPTWMRDSIPYIRPGALRRQVRSAYRVLAPSIIQASRGAMRQLPQSATDRYLTRIVTAVRHWSPQVRIAMLGPSSHRAPSYPSHRHHEAARAATRRWCSAHDVAYVDVDPWVLPSLHARTGNPDGLHWSWEVHAALGAALGSALQHAR
jgi:hypothetical protein